VEQCVALTFDDGPGPYTDKLLDELATRDVHATFFVVGKNIEARGKTVKREFAEGHVVGNHSWDHADLSKLSWQGVAQEIDSTNTSLTNLGLPLPHLVRPPYGAQNPEVMAALKARGQIGTFWSIDTEDWKNRDVAHRGCHTRNHRWSAAKRVHTCDRAGTHRSSSGDDHWHADVQPVQRALGCPTHTAGPWYSRGRPLCVTFGPV